jgi:hypothetical protein
LNDHREAGFFQRPGDPFRPSLVGLGVADEKIFHALGVGERGILQSEEIT